MRTKNQVIMDFYHSAIMNFPQITPSAVAQAFAVGMIVLRVMMPASLLSFVFIVVSFRGETVHAHQQNADQSGLRP